MQSCSVLSFPSSHRSPPQNARVVRSYTRTFGDDYFAFMVDGVKCFVLNSQLLKEGSGASCEREDQWKWLRSELAAADTAAARHVLAFCHVPPFIYSADEPSAYFNLDAEVRTELLSLLARHGVRLCFCGHYHRNAGGLYTDPAGRELEVVVTGACGVNIVTREGSNPLEIEGIGGCTEVSAVTSGVRLVRVAETDVTHAWYTIEQLGISDVNCPGYTAATHGPSVVTHPPSQQCGGSPLCWLRVEPYARLHRFTLGRLPSGRESSCRC